MNKKFLSAILFGALMVSSTGTFVSCKDYDDDIDNLQGQIDGVKTQIAELESKIKEGKYITSVTQTENGLTFTMNDGQTYNVTNGKDGAQGELGAAGDKVVIDEATGAIIINDKETGYFAVKNTETGKVVVPTIDKDGFWCLVNEKGELEQTSFKASPISAVQDPNTKAWTLRVWNTETKAYDEIELPTAASLITELEVLGYCINGNLTEAQTGIKYNFKRIDGLTEDLKKWNKEEGVKKVSDKQVLSTLSASNSSLLIRVAPATVDASAFSFTMINSQMKEAPIVLDAPEAYEELLVRASVSGNGLWSIPTSAKEGETYDSDNAYIANFKKGNKTIAFALKENNGFATNYDLTFEYNSNISLDAKVEKVNGNPVVSSKATERDKESLQASNLEVNKVNVGQVNITIDKPIYDAHLHIDDATIQRWNITDINGTSFKVGKRPDDITSANFQVHVHYVTLKGEVKNEWIPMTVAKSFAGQTVLTNTDHMIKAKVADDKFSVSLDKMFTDLANNAALWKSDVVKATTQLYQVGTDNGKDKLIDTPENVTFQIQNKDNGDVTNQDTKNATKFSANFAQNWPATGEDYALDKEYYVLVSFLAENSDVLNTVKVPFTMNIPELSTFLVKQQGVFNGTNDGTAYIFSKDYNVADNNVIAMQYDLTYGFVKLAEKLKPAGATPTTLTFKTNGYINGDDQNAEGAIVGLAAMSQATKGTVILTQENVSASDAILMAKSGKNSKVYGKKFVIEVDDAKYVGKYAYSDDDKNAQKFTITMKSPIKEGSISAADGSKSISIDATDQQKIVESKFLAKTYSTAGTKYELFPSDNTKKNNTIYGWISYNENGTITITSKDDKVLKVTEIKNTTETTDDTEGSEGYVKVEPVNPAYDTTGDITVTVKDVWGFTISQDITINIKR